LQTNKLENRRTVRIGEFVLRDGFPFKNTDHTISEVLRDQMYILKVLVNIFIILKKLILLLENGINM